MAIVDHNNSLEIKKLIECNDVHTIPIRGEEYNLFILLYALIRNRCQISGIRKAYLVSYVSLLRPRLVITFADNYEPFYEISVKFPNVKTAFIQNGWRADIGDVFERLQLGRNYRVDYMFVFGRSIGNLYSKFVKGDIIPIGSFKNNSVETIKTVFNKKTIGFISQWRRPTSSRIVLESLGVNYQDFYSAEDILLPRLQKWCFSNGYSLQIFGSSIDDADEEKLFYSEILQGSYEFVKKCDQFSSYSKISNVEIVVSIDSTLGYECAARGVKTAFFNIRSDILGIDAYRFGWPSLYPDDGPFWSNDRNLETFDNILEFLSTASKDGWMDVSRFLNRDLMVFDLHNKILKENLSNILSASCVPEKV